MAYASTAHGLPGVFITFEGGEGVGKTTQSRFLAEYLKSLGLNVVRLREPGGTTVGEKLRSIVLDAKNDSLNDRSELFMYEAARAQIVSEVIRPALESGAVVLCDRFVDSTVAYQGYGRGLDPEFVRAANAFACQGITPDRTVLLTVSSTGLGLHRATRRLGADRLELAGTEFHERVARGFAMIAEEDPERVRTVSAASSRSETARCVWEALADLLVESHGVEAPSDERFASLDRPPKRRRGRGGSGRGHSGPDRQGGKPQASSGSRQRGGRRPDGHAAQKRRSSGGRGKHPGQGQPSKGERS